MLRGAAPLIAFLRDNARWLAAGFLLAFGSSFGQTYFIAIFSEPFRQEFGLSHGEWGVIYMVSTLASAAVFISLGARADDVPPRRLTMIVVLALAAVCLAMAATPGLWALPLLVFGLRLCGQGMLSHLSQTLTARWFAATRGRALAVAGFGYPLGEALAPLAAVSLIAVHRMARRHGLVAALCLVAVLALAPALWLLLGRGREPRGDARLRGVNDDHRPGGAGLDAADEAAASPLRSGCIAAGHHQPQFYHHRGVTSIPAHIADDQRLGSHRLECDLRVFHLRVGLCRSPPWPPGGRSTGFPPAACWRFTNCRWRLALFGAGVWPRGGDHAAVHDRCSA